MGSSHLGTSMFLRKLGRPVLEELLTKYMGMYHWDQLSALQPLGELLSHNVSTSTAMGSILGLILNPGHMLEIPGELFTEITVGEEKK